MKFFEEKVTPKVNAKERLIQALKARDSDSALSALGEINTKLTGVDQGSFQPELKDNLTTQVESVMNADEMASTVVYLGDGGLSRIVLAKDGKEIKVQLTYNSTEKVKSSWEKLFGK